MGEVGAGVCRNVFADGEDDEVSGVTRWACDLRNGLAVCAAVYESAGLNGWMEMQHLAEAGLSPVRIFRAVTLFNAEAIHLSHEIGTVEAGTRANLLLVRQDPSQKVHALLPSDDFNSRFVNPDL